MAKRQRSKGQGSVFKRRGRGPWIAMWYDHTGKRREHSTRTTDRQAAERILSRLITNVALRRDGVIDAQADRYAEHERRPIGEHWTEWEASLTAASTRKHAELTAKRAHSVLDAIRAERLTDLSASDVQSAIAKLREGGLSLQSCQHYLRAIKQFSRWLRRDGRTRTDTLQHLAGYNTSTDRKYERRPLDADELQHLIGTTLNAPTWRGLTGHYRAMLYRVAAGTGFRASELRSLTPGAFNLDAPTVTLHARNSKHRRDDLQPIRLDLAGILRPWLDSLDRDAPIWPGQWNNKAASMIRADLRRARARWIRETHSRQERRERRSSGFLAAIDDDGRRVDFHALRVTFITMLVKGGASVKEAQTLARHCDPKLTMNIYTQLGIHDLTRALDSLPDATTHKPERERIRATGTYDDGMYTPKAPQLYPQQLGCKTVQNGAIACDGQSKQGDAKQGEGVSQTPMNTGLSDTVRHVAVRGGKAADRIRTDDLRFTKPLPDSITPDSTTTYNGSETTPSYIPSSWNGNDTQDAELARVVAAWPSLSDNVQASILAMISISPDT